MNLVSIIIPCRNEEKFIGKCLNSLIKQDYPKEQLEILIVDGMSEDNTRDIIGEYTDTHAFIKILDNPQLFTPFGLNVGIKEAKGDVIIRMDAHAEYNTDYISQCLKYLEECKADNVGGVIETVPVNQSSGARSIALVLSSPFGVGNSYFRLGSEKPRWVDTVFGGCYRKNVFKRVGLFNEKLRRSQDIEFNMRLKKAGGKILLVPEIKAYYYPQSNLKDFFKHNFNDGIWTTYPLKFGIQFFSWRHLVPLAFIIALVFLFALSLIFKPYIYLFFLLIISYLLVNLCFSLVSALKSGDLLLIFVLPFAFSSRHFGYGLGSIWGFLKIIE